MWYPKKLFTAGLVIAASSILTACSTTPPGYDQQQAKIDALVAKAAAHAGTGEEDGKASLAYLEQVYKRNSDDPQAALDYARSLRKNDYLNRAALILKPFAMRNDSDAAIATEYAAIQTAMGNYIDAEQTARKAVLLNPKSGKAYHVLGIALDAQGHHQQAQVAFEKGLDNWEGNPSAILNNMGLNLAAQGFLDEALETLRKALDTAPDRREIERNLRIVSALQYQPPKTGTRLVPVPPPKPDKNDRDAKKAEALKSELEALAPSEEKEETSLEEVDIDEVNAIAVDSEE